MFVYILSELLVDYPKKTPFLRELSIAKYF